MSKSRQDDYIDEFNDPNDQNDEAQDSKKSSEFAALLNESFKESGKKLKAGDKIKGEVLVVGKDEVFVSTGTMNDGVVPRRELLDAEGNVTCKVGDKLDLFVVQVKGSNIVLSPKPTAKNLADDLEDAFDMMLPVEGRVSEVCKGGVRVAVMGKSAFCPISQLDLRFVEKPEDYVGKKFEFKITQFSEGGRNIVVSRRKFLEENKGIAEQAFQEEKKPGDVMQGVVTRIEKFGAFIEVAPGVEGLAHISEIGWSRIQDPHEVLSIGQEVAVKLLKTETEGNRLKISLSVKQASAQPWENMPAHIREGVMADGKVTRCMKFGAFVELSPGIEGLIPLSEMSYTKRVMRSDELIREGERISVMIKEINPDSRRILLSLKDAGSDPWALIAQKFPVGKVVTGKVERREAYGLFVNLEEGITGLLPKSKTHEQPDFHFDKFKVGDPITIQIGELRPEERRISLTVPGDEASQDWKEYSKSAAAQSSTSGFGGAFGAQLKAALDKKKTK